MTTTTSQLEQLRDKRDGLLMEHEIASLESQLSNNELANSVITEGWGDYINDFSDAFRGDPDFYGGPQQQPSRADDRKQGDNKPIFSNEQQLAIIRGVGEFISQSDSTAKGALETLTGYVIHTGFAWTADPEDADDPQSAQAAELVQGVIDRFLKDQRWTGGLDRELFKRKCRTGERFVRVRKVPGGGSMLDIYEPGWITEPTQQRQLEEFYGLPSPLDWKYGIATHPGHPDSVEGFWSFRYGDPQQGEFIPATEMSHSKSNVDFNVKRGLSDYYVSNEWITEASKLLRNALAGGSIQASIALYRTWDKGTKPSQINSAADAVVEFQSQLPRLTGSGGDRSIPTERFYPGKIVDHKGGELKAGPMGTSRGPQFVQLVQAGLRKAANSHSMPEFMYTGDASNANYSSTLVSESPFVKHCEALQVVEEDDTATILWLVVENATDGGALRDYDLAMLKRLVNITADPPDIATRDRDKEHRIRSEEHKAGILSRETWANEVGRDYEQERSRIAAEPPVNEDPGFGDQGGLPTAANQSTARATLESVQSVAEARVCALNRIGNDSDSREFMEATG